MAKRFSILQTLKKLGLPEPELRLPNSYLRTSGWLRSSQVGVAVDAAGQPLPWIPYPLIHFLDTKLRPSLRMFEFGAGYSTLWYAKRVAQVDAVDHDAAWFARLQQMNLPANIRLQHQQGEAYVQAVTQYAPYELIVVDGTLRNACMAAALGCLTPGGVLLLDNSDRPEYEPGIRQITSHGFRSMEWQGLAPIHGFMTQSTLFYRDGNALGI